MLIALITRSARGGRYGIRASALPLVTLLVAVGCTQMLGIDGDYVRIDDEGASGATDGRVPPAGETGGAVSDTGGAGPGATGGASTDGSSGGAGGSGGGSPAGGAGAGGGGGATACTKGTYAGKLSGDHTTSLAVGLPISVHVIGDVSFTLVPDAAGATAKMDGKMDGAVDLSAINLGNAITFGGSLTGAVDCATGAATGTIDGSYAVAVGFAGTFDGMFSNGKFTGHWNEAEKTAGPNYSGSGDWDATGP